MSEIRLLSSTAMKSSLDELLPDFERASGHTVAASYAASAQIAKRVSDGEACDVAIATDEGVETLTAQGRLAAGTGVDLARSGMGLAVQKGAPRPDISNGDAFKRALLAARSIGTSNPVGGGQSGKYLADIFQRLGIAEALRPKLTYGPGGPAGLIGLFLVRGEVEIGIQQMPELLSVPGIDIVGPLPPDIQAVTVFSAALSSSARDRQAAQALIRFLSSPQAAAMFRSKGLEAG